MPEPLSRQQFEAESWEWQRQRLEALMQRAIDRNDRWREQHSWPAEIKAARPNGSLSI